MDAYIPIATGQIVEQDILNQLLIHKLINNVWIHPTMEFYPRGCQARYHAIAENSLQIFKHAIRQGEEYFLMCNSNKMLPFIPQIEFIFNYITTHPTCGFVAYNPYKTRRNPVHVCVGFGIVRTEAAKAVKFDKNKFNRCQCLVFCREMRQAGWEVSYESKEIRLKKRSK